ncbi:hypothetical protein ABID95_004354 [Streptomyces atratus]
MRRQAARAAPRRWDRFAAGPPQRLGRIDHGALGDRCRESVPECRNSMITRTWAQLVGPPRRRLRELQVHFILPAKGTSGSKRCRWRRPIRSTPSRRRLISHWWRRWAGRSTGTHAPGRGCIWPTFVATSRRSGYGCRALRRMSSRRRSRSRRRRPCRCDRRRAPPPAGPVGSSGPGPPAAGAGDVWRWPAAAEQDEVAAAVLREVHGHPGGPVCPGDAYHPAPATHHAAASRSHT